MIDSQTLLKEYAATGSEAAFRELVARYINFVHATARRLVGGDAHLADDITQLVFINLAKKGRDLPNAVLLGGWLHQNTFHVATKAVRTERRRQSREREAVEMNILNDDSETNLRKLEPILDEAITRLGSDDRAAILLRFFEQRDFRAVGAALGSNEDAARMRVKRAVEKLQVLLKYRGVSLPVAAIGTALTLAAASAAPAKLAVATAQVALASAAKECTTASSRWHELRIKPKLGFASLGVVLVAGLALLVHQTRSGSRVEKSVAALQNDARGANELGPARTGTAGETLFARPPVRSATANAPAEPGPSEAPDPAFAALLARRAAKLKPSEVASYLAAHGRDAASLLAAFRTTDDPAFLAEAMQKHPTDPEVAFEAAIRKGSSPEERRQWLGAWMKAAPDNALPNYLSALDHFKAGQSDQALQDLAAAASKPRLQDYSIERARDDEEAYHSAGRSAMDAKFAASANLLMPHLAQVGELGRNLVEFATTYQVSGEEATQQTILQQVVNLGRRYQDPSLRESLLSLLVGINLERNALTAMDPNRPSGLENLTVQDRIDQLAQRRSAIKELNRQAQPLWQSMSDETWTEYLQRSQAEGEENALHWLVTQPASK
jgi:RNA polymerase sigma factor (sigma-70 family)